MINQFNAAAYPIHIHGFVSADRDVCWAEGHLHDDDVCLFRYGILILLRQTSEYRSKSNASRQLSSEIVPGGESLHKPKGCLDTPHVIFSPIALGNFLLSDWNALPSHSHSGDLICIVLIKVDGEFTEMAIRPLLQSPLLHDLGWLLQLEI